MRAVALSDKTVQKKITAGFIPLKIAIVPGTAKFPVDWKALADWRLSYSLMGGAKCEGFTCCSVISPDLEMEFGNTGLAFVWEIFDSIAYNADKFAAMLDRSLERHAQHNEILANEDLSNDERQAALAAFRLQVRKAISREDRFHLPPKGFTVDGAVKLSEMTGDLPKR